MIQIAANDVDPCTGEAFAFEGTIRQVYQQIINDNRTLRLVHENTSNMHGIGENGTRYSINEGGLASTTISVPLGGGAATHVARYHITSQNSGDNFMLNFVERVDITPDGEVTARFSRESITCTG